MDNWWKNGVAFSCTQCAKCCSARDDIAYVYVNKQERQLIADNLRLSLPEFTRKYSKRNPDGKRYLLFVNGDCIFLVNKKCTIHHCKPTQCRTWPFWEEVMASREDYQKMVLDFCPGSNVDLPLISSSQIDSQIQETEDAFFEV
ncbi:MAG: YkgJ family cysteine cluster protein [Planctomycetes bacterium]|nr:YkgJ family cysteine cluster protein [Planctomycetota bacterium]